MRKLNKTRAKSRVYSHCISGFYYYRQIYERMSALRRRWRTVALPGQKESEQEEKKKMKGMKTNMIYGAIATVGVAIFGKYWYLFAGFLILNVVDYFTGWIKAKYYKKNESSSVGAKGILKKVLYWVVIGIAFFVSLCFVKMGKLIGINLVFVQFFGRFTLATYLINEIRSILENLIEMNVTVPEFLVKGMEISQKLLDAKTEIENEEEQEEE